MPDNPSITEHLVLFDGYCGICNNFVDFVISRDHSKKFLYTPLQGSTASTLDEGILQAIKGVDSVVYLYKGKAFIYSTAALMIMKELGGFYGFLGTLGLVFPKFIRDTVYKLIAKYRYRFIPRKLECRIPTIEERSMILP